MDVDKIEYLLRKLGVTKIKVGMNGWVHSQCPFAQWTHRRGIDRNPSFGISIAPGGSSRYKCWGCSASGDMTTFAFRYQRQGGRLPSGMANMIMQENSPSADDLARKLEVAAYGAPKAQNVSGVRIPAQSLPLNFEPAQVVTLPEEDLDAFEPPAGNVKKYLNERGFSDQVLAEWEIGMGAGRISIPVRDRQGCLVGISGRATRPTQKPKYMHSTGFRRDFYLYGEHKVEEGERCYITEGFFDVINLHQLGYKNALSVFGSSISDLQVEKIVSWFNRVVIVPDGDDPGKEGAAKIQKALSLRIQTVVVNTPNGEDPGSLTKEQAAALLGELR